MHQVSAEGAFSNFCVPSYGLRQLLNTLEVCLRNPNEEVTRQSPVAVILFHLVTQAPSLNSINL